MRDIFCIICGLGGEQNHTTSNSRKWREIHTLDAGNQIDLVSNLVGRKYDMVAARS
jgi:hypothetical protein